MDTQNQNQNKKKEKKGIMVRKNEENGIQWRR